jgi:AcrR family transcriptional regulator
MCRSRVPIRAFGTRTQATETIMAQSADQPKTERRVRRARGSLDGQAILRGAFELVESTSVDALSMPRLAKHLNVGVTTIYWYFGSKEELLDAMTAAALNRFYERLPQFRGMPWNDHVKAFFREFRRIFREDDVLCDLVIMRVNHFTPENLRSTWDRIEGVLETLVAAGFSNDAAVEAYFTLSVYTRGNLMIERLFILTAERANPKNMQTGLQSNPGNRERYPILADQATRRSFSMIDDDDFDSGLDTLVEGLRSQLASQLPAPQTD